MTALDPARTRPAAPRAVDETDAHLLRLCLDLQLDAMLLALGAAAAQRHRGDDDTDGAGVPWRRWVDEDVELATRLAADAMTGRATLPAPLGGELDHAVPASVVDDLVARYASMRNLLTDLLSRDVPADEDAWQPQVRDDDAWRSQVRDALRRCGTRLAELRGYRLTGTPPRGVRTPAATRSPLAPERAYLPGELLG